MNPPTLTATDKLWEQLNEMVLSFGQSMELAHEQSDEKQHSEVAYQEIELTEAPSVIKSVLSNGFHRYKSLKYFVGNNGSYKVVASNDHEKCSIYFER